MNDKSLTATFCQRSKTAVSQLGPVHLVTFRNRCWLDKEWASRRQARTSVCQEHGCTTRHPSGFRFAGFMAAADSVRRGHVFGRVSRGAACRPARHFPSNSRCWTASRMSSGSLDRYALKRALASGRHSCSCILSMCSSHNERNSALARFPMSNCWNSRSKRVCS